MIIGTHIPPIPLESDIDFKNDMIMEYMKSNLNYLGTLCVGNKWRNLWGVVGSVHLACAQDR